MSKKIELWEDWWTEPEDASVELTLARKELKEEFLEWAATIPRWDNEKQQFVKPQERDRR